MPLAAAVSLPSPTPGPREPRLRRTLDAVHRPSPPHCPHRRPPAGLAQIMEDVEATARGRVSQHHRHERGSRGLRALRRRRPRAPALRGNPWAQGVWCRRCPTASCSRAWV
ncbi:Pentatricopeptide repeat-containing protein [Zea mays]|uniref:Pentatricopeptide repeat-containing protein n=1 Tax=Zea mays TaxID=4577 RepID=A0A1D6I4T2_MAIZE|nr:Pentatricopeptide repeat-containing protein [Zea mays]